MASPEMSLALSAQAEVAQSFGLPTWGLAGSTDSKVIDAQAGIEATFSILAQGLAGLNLIHDVGYIDNGMACSTAQLVLGNESIGMTKRFIRGIEVNRESLALEVIEKVGPGGHYLDQDHTYDHFKSELWMPSLFTRSAYEDWQNQGAKDMAARIQEKLEDIVKNHQAAPLPDKTLATLREIKQKGEKELVGD